MTDQDNKDLPIDEQELETTEEVVQDDFEIEADDDATPADKLKKLREKIQQLQDEKAEYLDGWQRCQADVVNIKKQHEDERKTFINLGKQSLLEEIIPILDNFDAAFSGAGWDEVPEAWRIGVEYIYQQFVTTLENNGVKQFGAEGDAFDPAKHEPTSGEGEKVVKVVQKGYMLGERVVKAAKVQVG